MTMPLTDRILARLSEIEAAAKAATPGPWKYRPNKYDDWGLVRAANGWSIGQIQAAGREGCHWEDYSKHREAGTDPNEHNAKFIATADPPTVLALCACIRGEMESAVGTLNNLHDKNVDEYFRARIREIAATLGIKENEDETN